MFGLCSDKKKLDFNNEKRINQAYVSYGLVIYPTKHPEKDIATKLDKNHFFIVISVYIYHFQGLGPILTSKNVFCFLDTEG